MEQFVAATLRSAKSAEMEQLAAQYQGRIRQTQLVQATASAAGTAPGHGREPVTAGVPAQPLRDAGLRDGESARRKAAAGSDAEVPAAAATAILGREADAGAAGGDSRRR